MILQSLNELYDRLATDPSYELASLGRSLQKITFKVVLTPEGQLFAIQDARVVTEARPRPRQVLVLGSAKPPGSGLNPCFLWDNSSYLLGYRPEDPKPDRTASAFDAFRQRHLELENSVNAPPFSAVCRFLERWDPATVEDHPGIEDLVATGFGVFQIQGELSLVHENEAIVQWWESQPDTTGNGTSGQCLVTGESSSIARIHPKVKGVIGGQGSGASIAGFNEQAYWSYGKTQSFNAPVSEDVAFRYVTALNALLDGPRKTRHKLSLGDTTVAFWTDHPSVTEDIYAGFLNRGSEIVESSQDEGQRKALESFLRALRSGRSAYTDLAEDPHATSFCILGLSPNAARVSVRFFHRGTIAELLDNLRRHHTDIGIEPAPAAGKRRADPEFPSASSLLKQTGREAKDVPPILAGPLLHSIITGSPYPVGLFSAVIRRIRADRRVNYLRCCALKGYLNRNRKLEVSMSLDSERPDPAYRLGRLFAALEKTQQDALGGHLNATIRDRFYGSASATPGSVIPRLLRTYQHHLSKLEGGRRVVREKLVQEILAPLDHFPSHLALEGQGLFALGYYHQTRDFYTKRSPESAS